MATLSVTFLIIILIALVFISGFFSSSETGMMSLNRYRLRHLAKSKKHRAAKRTLKLLERPDRLLGIILIGNTFANVFASSVATIIALRFWGEVGIAIATFILTMIILIFAEMAPKTLAALYPEKVAFTFSLPLTILLKVIYPLVWFANVIANSILFIFGVRIKKGLIEPLSREELRTVVFEAAGKIPTKHQNMLLSILDLEDVTVEDIMVPRNEIVGIDIEDTWEDILEQLRTSQHTRLPLYRGVIDNVIGILHARKMLGLMSQGKLTKDALLEIKLDSYFIPEGTPLSTQLLNFQREQRRTALVVDEYGDIQGLVTLEDILEEIVGEFTTDFANFSQNIHPQDDGSVLVDGSINLRNLNRVMGWHFNESGPKTLNGLIMEHLEMIPRAATCIKIDGYPIEIVQVKDNMVKTARVVPKT